MSDKVERVPPVKCDSCGSLRVASHTAWIGYRLWVVSCCEECGGEKRRQCTPTEAVLEKYHISGRTPEQQKITEALRTASKNRSPQQREILRRKRSAYWSEYYQKRKGIVAHDTFEPAAFEENEDITENGLRLKNE